MRVHATYPGLLAIASVLLLPVCLLAHTPFRARLQAKEETRRVTARPGARNSAHAVAVSRKAGHAPSRKTGHTVARATHPMLVKVGRRHVLRERVQAASGMPGSKINAAAVMRVHAFERSQQRQAQQSATAADFVKAADTALGRVAAASAEDKEISHGSLDASADGDTAGSGSKVSNLKIDQEAGDLVPSDSAMATEAGDPMSVVIKPAARAALAQAWAGNPVLLSALYKHGRLVMPAALKGSREILVHQNVMADGDGLDRIRDDDDLDRMRRAGLLVALPVNSGLHVDERLPVNRRYCRPWTALFLEVVARQHDARFGTALQVNSAVRTVEFQQRLIRTNGNAAPASGDTASPHLTGQAVDIAKHGLTMEEIAWLRAYLLPLVEAGKIDVEEEFQQACFHISVYKKYMPAAPVPRRLIATGRGANAGAGIGVLATAMR